MLRKIFLLFVTVLFAVSLYAQQTTRVIKQWYDKERHQLKREYAVLSKNPKVLEGSFKSYYSNGRLQTQGLYKQNQPTGLWQYFYENGLPRMNGTMLKGKAHALWKYYYENGNLSQSGEWEAGEKSGNWKYYFESGGLQSEGIMTQGKYDGLWKYYYEDGTLKATALFEEGEGAYKEYYATGKLKMKGALIEGKSEGMWQYFHENGQLKAEGIEKNGLREGEWKFYHSNGLISSVGHYLTGETIGKWKYFHENGKLSAEGEEVKGQREGYWKLYYDSGKFKAEGTFNAGNGTYQEYYESGKLKVTGTLQKGKSVNGWKYYYEDGLLEGSCFFKDGEGIYSGFYKNGQLKMQGKIKDGERIGTWSLYNEDGTLAGHYSAFYEEHLARLFLDDAPIPVENPVDSLQPVKKPDIVIRKRKIRYFTPLVNEIRTVIISANPLAIPFNQLPFSAEYYLQERQGLELGFIFHKQPFFTSVLSLPAGKVFQTGLSIHLKHKFYHPGQYTDTWYFGHELRYTALLNGFMEKDSVGGDLHINKVQLYEKRIEYNLLIGSRMFKSIGNKGLSLDIYTGLGFGYRHLRGDWEPGNNMYNRYFPVVYKPSYYFPFRLGCSVGYYF